MEINDKPNNNLDDVFLTDIDEQSCQKIISQIEEQRAIETIKNVKKKCKFSLHIMRLF